MTTTNEALGISKERTEELEKEWTPIFQDSNTTKSQTLLRIMNSDLPSLEKYFLCYVFGRSCAEAEIMSSLMGAGL